ncbi:MAG: alpha/beta fold hydrolase [Betaproteobacteria bacterium]|nr:alpha/beta fold hydrolase [Betaproteobacteria bacterium]
MNSGGPFPKSSCSRLAAADGYPLAVTRYALADAPRGSVVVAGATGVPQGFYRRFAEHLAAQGFLVTTFDYRGIGQSKPSSLKGFEANFLEWACFDLAAVIDASALPGMPLFLVGHSFGGHAFGLLPNHARVAGFYTFATGAGWAGWMPRFEGLRVRFMWTMVTPLLTRWKGYLPWSLLRRGEDLPLGIYRQWRRWCNYPHYFFDDPQLPHLAERFAAVRTPIIAANALDDAWAPPASRDAFMQAYRNAPQTRLDLDPSRLGGIGHMGYFRQKAQPLWDQVGEWFDTLAATPKRV